MVSRLKRVIGKGVTVIKEDGVINFTKRAAKYAYYKQFPDRKKQNFKDILFINGCTLAPPTWYRVDHQMEQLISSGISCDSVFYDSLTLDMLKYYRGFVFFRCPVTNTVREFIGQAKRFNKACFFDIDDLVIDTKYTNQIEYVANMSKEDKAHYEDGVNRMQETLRLCDYAITTTGALKRELENYCDNVYVNRNVASDEIERYSEDALKKVVKDDKKIIVGYFSGSITHNEDFEFIIPDLIKLLDKHENLYLKVTGIIDIPESLQPYAGRIISDTFRNQREFPALIASCDVAIAPLTQSVFNEAKSENKWLLPSLVKVPTVASRLGAFEEVVEDGVTGLLAGQDEWFDSLDKLISSSDLRKSIGENAYKKVKRDYITVYSGGNIAKIINDNLARNVGFVLPSTDISGGVIVALKHAEILKKHGWDVTIFDAVSRHAIKESKKTYTYRQEIDGYNVVMLSRVKLIAFMDTIVATLWATVNNIKKYPNAKNRLYFVQNYETDFYVPGSGFARFDANATYGDQTGVKYITMSLWCKRWLKDKFNQDAKYASNGIDLSRYSFRERSFTGKIKLLVEGDSRSEYKNTDEAFRIIQKLDPEKYEVSYLSYRREPKDWYRVDHFYNRIAPEKVGEVYASCDILIKTSLLESFSYPPLEMMATGGVSVVVPNDGNVEYLRDKYNCLFYEQGNIDAGARAVEELVENKQLRDILVSNGLDTAENYQWDRLEEDIVNMYR